MIQLTVNGRAQTVDVDPTTPLLYVLSDDLQLRGPKFGCGLGQCGACTVIIRGRAVDRVLLPSRRCRVPRSPIGNAIFDATGVRLREVPFTPERVKAALFTDNRR